MVSIFYHIFPQNATLFKQISHLYHRKSTVPADHNLLIPCFYKNQMRLLSRHLRLCAKKLCGKIPITCIRKQNNDALPLIFRTLCNFYGCIQRSSGRWVNICHRKDFLHYLTASNPCCKSARISSICSVPMERRTVDDVIPALSSSSSDICE